MASNETGGNFEQGVEELTSILTGSMIDKTAALSRFNELFGDGGAGEEAYVAATDKKRPTVMDQVGTLGRQAIDHLLETDETQKLVPPLTDEEKTRLIAKHSMLAALMDSESPGESKKATSTKKIKTDGRK